MAWLEGSWNISAFLWEVSGHFGDKRSSVFVFVVPMLFVLVVFGVV